MPGQLKGKSRKPLIEDAMALMVRSSTSVDCESAELSFCVSVGTTKRWQAVAKPVGDMEFRVHFHADPEFADDSDPYASQVRVIQSNCHFGGKRFWLVCPTTGCGRRTAKLFRIDGKVACRTCAKFSYRSQRERAPLRALRKAQAIRQILGATGNSRERFPARPKWMQQMTYIKYLSKALFWERKFMEAPMARFRMKEIDRTEIV